MTITKLIVGGFKSLRDLIEIPLAPLTLMFGPNSAGKSAAKEAWQELKRLLDASDDRLSGADVSIRRLNGSKSRNAFLPQGGMVDEDSDDHVVYRVVLGCHVEDLDTEVGREPYLNSRSSGLALELYKDLHGREIQYVIANNPDDLCASLNIKIEGAGALLFNDYVIAVVSGLIEAGELSNPRVIANLRSSILGFGLLCIDFSALPFNSTSIQGLQAKLFNLAGQQTNSWLAGALRVEGSTLLLRIDLYGRRFVSWQESLGDHLGGGFGIDPEILACFAPIGELVELLNEFLHQVEAAIARDMEIGLVSGDRQRLKPQDHEASWPDRLASPMSAGAHRLMKMYALYLGATASGKWGEVFPGNFMAPPQDDLVNDLMRGGLFSPRNYSVKADFSISTVEVLASRNDELVGDEKVDYRAALYLVDEQQRTLDFDQVGSGVSYALPVLTSLWGCQRSWIEQPELHLHPAAQCEMGDAVVRAFNRGRFSVIETHSEHLLLRILRRIRQTSEGKVQDRELQCQPEAVAVLYFSPQPDGSTQVHQLRVTRGGDFMDQWPDGFFEERSRELFDE